MMADSHTDMNIANVIRSHFIAAFEIQFTFFNSILFIPGFLSYSVSGSWSLKQGEFFLLESPQVKSDIDWLHPQTWYHHCPSISRNQDRIVYQRVCGLMGVYVSPFGVYRKPSYTKHANVRTKQEKYIL